MTLVIPDLSADVVIAGLSLNNVVPATVGGRMVLIGNRVDFMDVGPAEPVQFKEKLALVDGMDYGGVWKGARNIDIKGITFASSRAAAFAAVSLIEAAVTAVSGTFGLVAITFTSGGVVKSITARPNGLHVPSRRNTAGGVAGEAISIGWEFTAHAMNPAVT